MIVHVYVPIPSFLPLIIWQIKMPNLRSSERARAKTRAGTATCDGAFKKKRQQAEMHIATLVCRHAVLKAGKNKFSVPRHKLREVFESMSQRVYSEYHCSLDRVKGHVYKMLKQRGEMSLEVENEDSEYESENEEEVSYFILVFKILYVLLCASGGFDKTLFFVACYTKVFVMCRSMPHGDDQRDPPRTRKNAKPRRCRMPCLLQRQIFLKPFTSIEKPMVQMPG